MEIRTVKFLVRLFIVLAIAFGGLSIFAFVVPWAKFILPISLANLVLCVGMALMDSILLDKLKNFDE